MVAGTRSFPNARNLLDPEVPAAANRPKLISVIRTELRAAARSEENAICTFNDDQRRFDRHSPVRQKKAKRPGVSELSSREPGLVTKKQGGPKTKGTTYKQLSDAELFHAASQSGDGQVENLRRAAVTANLTFGVTQRFLDMRALHLFH